MTIAVESCRNLNPDDVIAIPMLDSWAIYPENIPDEEYFRQSMSKQQADWQSKFGAYGYKEFKKLLVTQKHRLELLYRYKMKNVSHDIILFKSNEIMDIFSPIDSHDNNWTRYADGNHETMFQYP